jgi:serine/threonine protein phosphatase PrpC
MQRKNGHVVKSLKMQRPSQEDRYQILHEKNGVRAFAVYDGHAGAKASSILSGDFGDQAYSLQEVGKVDPLLPLVVKFLCGSAARNCCSLGASLEGTDVLKQVQNMFVSYDTTHILNHDWDDGSTAVLAIVLDNRHVHLFWTGDSRAVVLDDAGNIVARTKDHKPKDPDEEARITNEAKNAVLFGRVGALLAVSRAFGDKPLKEVAVERGATVSPVIVDPSYAYAELPQGGRVALFSDGFYEKIDTKTYEKMLSDGKSADDFFNMVWDLKPKDNTTFIIAELSPSSKTLSEAEEEEEEEKEYDTFSEAFEVLVKKVFAPKY